SRLGIDSAHARQRPEDKLAFVRSLQAEGHVVAMVGDGLNDAPVLAGADVSLAMDKGAALAQRAADLVATGPTLARIPAAIAVARRTRAVIRENLGWALGYNLLAIPLAAFGLVTPWVAALGMAGSSLVVTLNALRLTRHKVRARLGSCCCWCRSAWSCWDWRCGRSSGRCDAASSTISTRPRSTSSPTTNANPSCRLR